jgi:hypothetical protein
MTGAPKKEEAAPDAPPGVPGFRSWKGIYLFVIVTFVVMVAFLAWFSRAFQ